MKLPRRDNFCIWPRALPRCRPCRASRGRKPIRRGRCVLIVGFPAGGARRHRRAPDGSMAVGAARPAIHHREPAGRRRQYRHRGGRERARRRLHAPSGHSRRTRSTRRSTTSSISISSATSRRSRASIRVPNVMEVNPSVPAKTVPEFIAYAKANPGKINMASAGNGTPQHVAGELFKMMAGVDMLARALSRRGARADRSARRTSAGHVRHHAGSIEHIRAGKLRALAVTTAARVGGAAGRADRRRFRAGLRGERLAWRRRAQEHARRDRRQAQQGDQRGSRRSQDQGAACRPGRHGACAVRPPTSASSSPTKPRNGAR